MPEKRKDTKIMSPEEKQRMGDAIRRLRNKHGLLAKELAALSGIRAETISSWERGHTFPDWPQLQAVAEALDIPMAEIIAEYEGIQISVGGGRVSEEVADYIRQAAEQGGQRALENFLSDIKRKTETEKEGG